MAVAIVPEVDETMMKVTALDFSKVMQKLRDADEGPGWTSDRAEAAEREYRRFLALKLLYPEEDIVPDADVDSFWHQHILDTRAYATDSAYLFGHFLHHDPYFGLASPAERVQLHAAFARSRKLYQQHFGDDSASRPTKCHSCRPTRCK